MISDTSTLEVIEWHDGTFESLEVRVRSCILAFASVYVYRKLEPERFSVDSCRATLSVVGVVELHLEGALEEAGWISDCEIEGESSSDNVQHLLSGMEARSVHMTFTNGSKLEIRCERIKLELLGEFEPFETWEGPL